ncbi:carbohydrate ABC transporter membrane protein 1 (CUT1 family) [Microterricola gilva]|uniref:Carbohydrate ABC transporter membrane protein 1 (CUT1 family) n=1 Tax=Microterricola gilva TaxID=393267 RepID=A0A4Q8ANW9_9MICO|nr:carbohydrate ABC transporter membrane protein 1 (CUT1 family) [Microterricola gilva]
MSSNQFVRHTDNDQSGLPAGRASARPAPGRAEVLPYAPIDRDAAGAGHKRRNRLRGRAEIALFAGPALVVYLLFVMVPVGLAGYYGFFKWNGIGPLTDFVGLDNYVRALSDPVFIGAIGHNFFFVIASLLVQGPIAIGIALLLNRPMRGRSFFRVLVFVPYVLSEVIAGVAWLLLLQPNGPFDALLTSLGLGDAVQLWLGDPTIVLWTMLAVISWKYIGFAIILFLAGLQGVPEELAEAAQIDGASWWQIQRHITIPLLGPTIRIWAFLSIIGSLQLFDLVWIMTGGGPANATSTMATYMINFGFTRSQYGYGSAVAVILFIISFAIAIVYQRFVLRRDTEGALTRRVG